MKDLAHHLGYVRREVIREARRSSYEKASPKSLNGNPSLNHHSSPEREDKERRPKP